MSPLRTLEKKKSSKIVLNDNFYPDFNTFELYNLLSKESVHVVFADKI